MLKAWKSITLWKRVLIGLVIGLVVGLSVRYGLLAVGADKLAGVRHYEVDGKFLTVDEYSQVDQTGPVENYEPPSDEAARKLEEENLYWLDGKWVEAAEYREATQRRYEFDGKWLPSQEYVLTWVAWIGDTWIKPFGDAFVRLIKMLVIPLVFTTLVSGVTAMGDPKKLGSLGAKTIGLYLLTTLFAVTLGLVIGTIVKPGAGVDYGNKAAATENAGESVAAEQGDVKPAGNGDSPELAESKKKVQDKLKAAEESGSFVDRLLAIIPTNPAEALAKGDVLGAIFFAVMVGIGVLNMGSKADPVKNFFDAAAEVVMAITLIVMEVAPFGVLALMAWVMATQGVGVLESLGLLAFSLYLACFIQITCVYGGLIVKGFLRLPLIQFFRGVADAQGVAFSTASSSGTLPVTINCAEKNLGVNKSVASSVLPLGATINMDGTAIYLGLIALFAAQSTGVELTLTQYFMVALTATLVSVGAAGIPSAGLLLAATVLNVIGIKESDALLVIAFIYPFDRLLDMMRTVTNVTGDVAVACTVAKWENALDEETFRAPPVTQAS